MKRIQLLLACIATSLLVSAQTEFDAFKYLQPDIFGTARYSSMAGAFGALGADPSAIKDNPAGLGIYRSSEISATINQMNQSSEADWMRTSATDGLRKGGFNQFAYIIAHSTTSKFSRNAKLNQSNWSFSYNRLKNFNRQLQVNGGSQVSGSALDYISYFTGNIAGYDLYDTDDYNPYNNTSVPWISVAAANAGLITEYVYDDNGETAYWAPVLENNETVAPSYFLRESGHLDEYSISWSGNFNNRLFLGASVNIYDMQYTASSEYKETFSVVGDMSLNNYINSSSSAVGVRVGAIYIPVDFLRLGASVRAPLVYSNSDVNYIDLEYDNGGNDYGTIYSPEGYNDYKLQSPMVVNLSAALIQSQRGVIGVEYMYSKNNTAKFMDDSNNSFNYRYENDSINAIFSEQHMLKIGGEYKLTNRFAIRAGYAFSTEPAANRLSKEMNPNTTRTDIEYFVPGGAKYYTGGIGYRDSGWAFDLAVVNKVYEEEFFAYNPNKVSQNLRMPSASVTTSNLSLLATVSLRF